MRVTAIAISVFVLSIVAGRAAEYPEALAQGSSTDEQYNMVQSNAVSLGLSPSAFSASPQEASARLLAATKYKRMNDGLAVVKGDLSRPVADAVEQLGRIVIPSIEFRQTDPKDILRFISTAQTIPEPDKTHSIGLIYEQPEPITAVNNSQATELIDELSLDATPVTCSLQRVNLLEFIERVSRAMKVDVGFTQEGKIVFGRNDKWSSRSRPAYLMQFAE